MDDAGETSALNFRAFTGLVAIFNAFASGVLVSQGSIGDHYQIAAHAGYALLCVGVLVVL